MPVAPISVQPEFEQKPGADDTTFATVDGDSTGPNGYPIVPAHHA